MFKITNKRHVPNDFGRTCIEAEYIAMFSRLTNPIPELKISFNMYMN